VICRLAGFIATIPGAMYASIPRIGLIPSFLHSLKNSDHAEHAAVIGMAMDPSQGLGAFDQIGDPAGAVEQGIMGVNMQVRKR